MAARAEGGNEDAAVVENRHRPTANVPEPKHLVMHAGCMEQNWKRWKREWQNYIKGRRIENQDDDWLTSVFLGFIGPDANDVYDGFDFADGEDRKMAVILAKFDEFCIGATNEVYEAYKFFKRNQEPGETVDAYVTVLRRLVKNCSYGNPQVEERILRDRVVAGVTNEAVRQKFLQEQALTLRKCIDIARVHETSTVQAKLMGEDQIHKVTEKKKSHGHSGGGHKSGSGKHKHAHTDRDKTVSTNVPLIKCKFCGYEHKKGKRFCKAWGRKCKGCGMRNHFISQCGKQGTVHALGDSDDDSDSYDEENILVCLSENDAKQKEKESCVRKKSEREFVQSCDVENSVHARMIVNDVSEIVFQLDSGATINSMSERLYKQVSGDNLLKNVKDCAKTLVMYDKSTIKPLGEVVMHVKNPKTNDDFKVRFVLVKEAVRPILGCRAVQLMGLLTVNFSNISVVKTQSESLDVVVNEFSDVFEGELGELEGRLDIVLDEKIAPVKLPCRRWPSAVKDKVKDELNRLEGLGVVEKVDQPTDWISSLVVIMKPNGKARLCIDPKPLNKAIKRNHYPMKTLDDVMEELGGAEYFTHLDARNGFWHVVLGEESKRLTTFETPFGKYCWKRMPFGISSAPEEFQRRIDEALRDLPGVFAVHDDIICWGRSQEGESASDNHDRNLRGLLQRCRDKGVKLNREKLELKKKEISYLGHKISKDGVKADPKKVDAIQRMEIPTDKEGVQRLLGMVGYLQRYAPQLSEAAAPMRELVKKNVHFRWDDRHSQALEKVKAILSAPPTLKFFNASAEITLQCDASSFGLGACLMNDGQPVQFASRALTEAERNYAQIEKEMLAVVFGLERFERYVYGNKLVVETDHKPLIPIHKKSLLSAPKRLQRMLLRTQKFMYEIVYKPGKEMVLADTLSRAVPAGLKGKPEEKEEIFQTSVEKEIESINMAFHIAVSPERLEELQNATKTDSNLQRLISIVLEGWPEERSELPVPLQAYFPFREEISLQNGLLFKGERIIVPEGMQNQVADQLHQAHQGIQSCLRRAREVVYWPGMAEQISELVGKCSTCQTFQAAQAKEPMISHPIPNLPWQYLASDLFDCAGKSYMVLVDYYSDFFEVDRIDNKTSTEVIYKMKAHFARHGIPERLVTDNGPCYSSQDFERFSKSWGFEHVTSSPLYPQSNGKAENAVKQAKNLMKKASESNSDPYKALLTLRNTPTETLKTSPAQRLFSRRTRTLVPTTQTLLKPQVSENVEEKLIQRKIKQASGYNKTATELSTLKPGQVVRVKAGDRWVKSKVERQVDVRSYKVQTEDGRSYRRNRRQLRATREDFQHQQAHKHTDMQERIARRHNELAFRPNTQNQQKPTESLPQETQEKEIVANKQQTGIQIEHEQNKQPERVSSRGRAIRKPAYLKDYTT